ncbi:hypothetical protein ACHQM5_008664 [Ranunculus cassubicifolius]
MVHIALSNSSWKEKHDEDDYAHVAPTDGGCAPTSYTEGDGDDDDGGYDYHYMRKGKKRH